MFSPNADLLGLAPKVELHLHLEGAIPPDTLWDLIEQNGGDSRVPTREALPQHLAYTSFPHFIDTWVWMSGFVRSCDDFEHIAAAVAAELARQHVVYAEASFSPTDFAHHGLTAQEIATAIRRGLDVVSSIKVVLICDLVRDTGPDRAGRTLDAVIDVMRDTDIRGITIGGSEHAHPPELFADVYRRASAAGLRLTAHAGEAAGPESVRGALDILGVERIGHGVRAVEDPLLLDRLVAQQVPLEVCPTSNIRTGVAANWVSHPVGVLLAAGANVTISSDDPTFFHTTVAAELEEVAARFGADPRALTDRAIAASWMSEAERDVIAASVADFWADPPGTTRGGG